MGRTPIIGSVAASSCRGSRSSSSSRRSCASTTATAGATTCTRRASRSSSRPRGRSSSTRSTPSSANILERDEAGSAHLIPQAEFDRVAASFRLPAGLRPAEEPRAPAPTPTRPPAYRPLARAQRARPPAARLPRGDAVAQARRPGAGRRHRRADGRGRRPGRPLLATASCASRTTRTWCCRGCAPRTCPRCGRPRKAAGFATPNIGLLTDMIACPGGDFCALANARSIPIAAAITERFDDLDELYDIGDIDLHISGCINSCGHHHSGHIGILGVDKDGTEWYQITLGGSDGSTLSGRPAVGQGDRPVVRGRRGARRDRGRGRHLPRPAQRRRRALHRHRAGASASTRSRPRPTPCAPPPPAPPEARADRHRPVRKIPHEIHQTRRRTRGAPSAATTARWSPSRRTPTGCSATRSGTRCAAPGPQACRSA